MRFAPADLRPRLGAGGLVLVLIAPLARPGPALVALALVLALYALEGRALPWRRLIHLEAFLALLFLTLPFTVPGTALLRLGPLALTDAGLARTLTLAAKVTASVLLLSALFADTAPEHLGGAMRAARLPEPLVRIFLGLVRYLALIRAEMARAQEAMRARAFHPGTNRHSWRAFGWLIGRMLMRALARADRVEEAMRLRSYTGRLPRPLLPPVGAADHARALALCAPFLAILIWELAR
ncbi:energy-coupling factor transporter transmembrane component T family protein [Rhodobacter maris]|uniref:Cobalt/nickel transport system permease protein n=1 Tax=Rhodobacter maris TaxID=446682 RepID=A0A285SSC3_9RHOB|nr:energy-coupling factor transporter transmembrane component T [Rhodobacter maris]SOC10831.1 cobalt/nickel transport system permease protein [Rhodobacter maris]